MCFNNNTCEKKLGAFSMTLYNEGHSTKGEQGLDCANSSVMPRTKDIIVLLCPDQTMLAFKSQHFKKNVDMFKEVLKKFLKMMSKEAQMEELEMFNLRNIRFGRQETARKD